jgi:flavin-dependent dehydrogenase
VRYQGNWIPHRLRPATEDGVFFCGDSAGHCLPLTAEGIRTAFYFGIVLGRELRGVVTGEGSRAQALRAYHSFSNRHRWKFEAMLAAQRVVPRVPPRLLRQVIRAVGTRAVTRWAFGHYLRIVPPEFAAEPSAPRRVGAAAADPLAA